MTKNEALSPCLQGAYVEVGRRGEGERVLERRMMDIV